MADRDQAKPDTETIDMFSAKGAAQPKRERPERPRFDGSDYDPKIDDARLNTQHARIKRLMLDGEWRTLRQIEEATGDPGASILAQLGHLRKKRFGAYRVVKERVGDPERGLWQYRVLPPLSTND